MLNYLKRYIKSVKLKLIKQISRISKVFERINMENENSIFVLCSGEEVMNMNLCCF